ncbi:hypothetical protein [Amycolatopsis sp. lyj-112]
MRRGIVLEATLREHRPDIVPGEPPTTSRPGAARPRPHLQAGQAES